MEEVLINQLNLKNFPLFVKKEKKEVLLTNKWFSSEKINNLESAVLH